MFNADNFSPGAMVLGRIYQFVLSWPDPSENQTALAENLLAGNSDKAADNDEVCNEYKPQHE